MFLRASIRAMSHGEIPASVTENLKDVVRRVESAVQRSSSKKPVRYEAPPPIFYTAASTHDRSACLHRHDS